MKYLIKIDYHTGGSITDEDIITYLENEWSDINVAEDNLKRIEEHYKYYQYLNRPTSYNKAPKPECWSGEDDEHDCGIDLLLDNGNIWHIRPFWIGYFESLHSAEIEIKTKKVIFY